MPLATSSLLYSSQENVHNSKEVATTKLGAGLRAARLKMLTRRRARAGSRASAPVFCLLQDSRLLTAI